MGENFFEVGYGQAVAKTANPHSTVNKPGFYESIQDNYLIEGSLQLAETNTCRVLILGCEPQIKSPLMRAKPKKVPCEVASANLLRSIVDSSLSSGELFEAVLPSGGCFGHFSKMLTKTNCVSRVQVSVWGLGADLSFPANVAKAEQESEFCLGEIRVEPKVVHTEELFIEDLNVVKRKPTPWIP